MGVIDENNACFV